MNPPQTPGLFCRGRLSAILALLAGCGLSMGASVTEVQHKLLPKFESSIEFVPFKGRMEKVRDEDAALNPGGWRDVRIVAVKDPLVTISGYIYRGPYPVRGFLCEDVHFMCFPAKLRPRIAEAAAAAAPILAASNDSDAIMLKDGTVLRKASVVSATPGLVTIEHEGGSRAIAPEKIATSYLRLLGLSGKFVYFRELALNDGRKFTRVRIAANDAGQCRLSHEGGSLGVPLDALPPVERSIVTDNLIQPGLFAEEVVTDPDSLVKRSAHSRGAPAPEPTPIPTLEKSGFNSYAVLPLGNGAVLRNAQIVGLGADRVTVLADGFTRSVSRDHLPEEVYIEAGGPLAPMFEELLMHGVVAKGGSPIFEITGPSAASADFGEAAIGARGGRTLARVGPGYLLMEGQRRDHEGGAVQFPKPLSKFTRGYVMAADFAHLGPESWRERWLGRAEDPLSATLPANRDRRAEFRPVELGKDTLLLDPFEARYTLFGNEQGVMKRAWRVEPSLRGGLAIVETKSGFYLGVLIEKSDLPESRMTWPELLAHRSGGYGIEKTGQRQLQPGSMVFQTTDLETNPERLLRSLRSTQIRPEHYRTLVDRGIESTRLHLETSQAEDVEVLTEPGGDFSETREVEVVKAAVQFRSMAAGSVVLQVVSDQRERDVVRTEDGRTPVASISKGAWKSRKVEKTFELQADPDGGLRFLEGDTIYELTFPKVGGYLLATYKVKANPLSRPPR